MNLLALMEAVFQLRKDATFSRIAMMTQMKKTALC
jgi:hypothetical protein